MLELKGISKNFGDRRILDDVNLTIPNGDILCIVGPSGAGKTTLLRAITGLTSVDAGQFLLDGKEYDPMSEQGAIGVVFQDFQLFPQLTVDQNVTLAPQLVLKEDPATLKQRTADLLSKLGLTQHAQQYPYQLSGGQKQRVAIARALAMQPQILAYDEPTSALDPAMRDEVAELLLDLKADGVTQLVVTHDLDFARKIADQIYQVAALEGGDGDAQSR
ncbi:ABC transporter, ATP-binding protein [Lactobacillus selangorensis]|uniref:ABC transporter, ATP-binding protein n=1 Tax=Lactobacillus selangorensis TaxID=81857 RepID=A0A0R2FLB2_9LACO|nr:amino acid ABC transporter ATP-binding protein [Lactobacillus selangorensis]KRN29352.1 ABC transporter, ATP-binding protein [Lactobacillus selangorensis]KRN34119.1 ABC transporter, ATP-binding protein [Lactobacillus selangorensis]